MNDLISRQAAIDAVVKYATWLWEMFHEHCNVVGVADALRDVPSAQQWIQCSERLPEEFYVLCCDNHGEMLIANPFECDDSDTGFSAESEDCYMYNCVAWMPLPEPYKGEEK